MAKKYNGIIIVEDIGSERVDFYKNNIVGRQDYGDRIKEVENKGDGRFPWGKDAEYLWSESSETKSELLKMLENKNE